MESKHLHNQSIFPYAVNKKRFCTDIFFFLIDILIYINNSGTLFSYLNMLFNTFSEIVFFYLYKLTVFKTAVPMINSKEMRTNSRGVYMSTKYVGIS